MNISILMAVGCQNLGDELILKNEIEALGEKYRDFSPQFQVFTYDLEDIFYKGENIEYFEYFPINIKNPRNILRNLRNFFTFLKVVKNSDLVVFGGGGIFYDSEVGKASNPLGQWYYRAKIIKFFRKKLMTYAVSLEVKREESTAKIGKIFSLVDEIFVRDEKSQKYLANLGIHSQVIRDPVFGDNKNVSEKNSLLESFSLSDFSPEKLYKYNFENKTVGLAFRSGFLQNEEEMIKKSIEIILKLGGEVYLLPHSLHKTDIHANDYLFLEKFVQKKVKIFSSLQDVYEVYSKKQIDMCISMRLHSMILCQSYGIDFIAIQYANKTQIFTK